MFLISFLRCATEKPKKPSEYLEKIQRSNSEAFERLVSGDQSDSRYCQFCEIQKIGRIHHCKRCKICVLSYDHFCPWLNSCIGIHNYRLFYLQAVYGCVLGFMMSFTLLCHLAKSIWQKDKKQKGSNCTDTNNNDLSDLLKINLTEETEIRLPSSTESIPLAHSTATIDQVTLDKNTQDDTWIDRASWTTLIMLIFVIALSAAVFFCLGELSIRYFRYIAHNITLMDKDKIPNTTSNNLQRIFGNHPILWFIPISSKYFPDVQKYSGFYIDGKEVIYI